MTPNKGYGSGCVGLRSHIGEILKRELSLDDELFENINFYFCTDGVVGNIRYYYLRINKEFRNENDREGIDIIVKQGRSPSWDVTIESVTFLCLYKLFHMKRLYDIR